MATPAPTQPFRWDVTRRACLGSLVAHPAEPAGSGGRTPPAGSGGRTPPAGSGGRAEPLWFQDELERCAAQVLARCGDARRLYFVGRSPASIFDVLGGALAGTSWEHRLVPLPFSMYGEHDRREVLARPVLRRQLEVNLASVGLRPFDLQRGRGGVAIVDLVSGGGTYGNLLAVLRLWTDASGAQWDVVRTKLRWVAITSRVPASRHHRRWHQDADWVETLPRAAVVNIALDARVWNHFGNAQPKVEHSFTAARWLDPGGPCREEHALVALATAVQLRELGRTAACRDRLARHLAAEPTMAEPWLRALAGELRRPPTGPRLKRRDFRGCSIPRGAR